MVSSAVAVGVRAPETHTTTPLAHESSLYDGRRVIGSWSPSSFVGRRTSLVGSLSVVSGRGSKCGRPLKESCQTLIEVD